MWLKTSFKFVRWRRLTHLNDQNEYCRLIACGVRTVNIIVTDRTETRLLTSSYRLSVPPPVCSVCKTVHRAVSAKSCISESLVLGGKFYFVRSHTFDGKLTVVYRTTIMSHKKRRQKRMIWRVFVTRKTVTTRALLYSALLTAENLSRSTSQTSLVTLEWV